MQWWYVQCEGFKKYIFVKRQRQCMCTWYLFISHKFKWVSLNFLLFEWLTIYLCTKVRKLAFDYIASLIDVILFTCNMPNQWTKLYQQLKPSLKNPTLHNTSVLLFSSGATLQNVGAIFTGASFQWGDFTCYHLLYINIKQSIKTSDYIFEWDFSLK